MMIEETVAEWRYSQLDGPVAVEREPMSDDEIHQAAMSEWLEVLSGLWAAYGKTPDAKQLAIYASVLADVPLGLLDDAIRRVIGQHEYNNVPTAAEIRRAVWEIIGRPRTHDFQAAIENWIYRTFEAHIVRFG